MARDYDEYYDNYRGFTIVAIWYSDTRHWSGYFGKSDFYAYNPEALQVHGGCTVYYTDENNNISFPFYGFDCVCDGDINNGPNQEQYIDHTNETQNIIWTKENVLLHLKQVIDSITPIYPVSTYN